MSQTDVAKYANFSDAELKVYEISKQRYFKGTIAVCAIYGAFAAILLLIAFFDARGREILTQDLLPFVVTFVACMVLIIIVMVIQVIGFKPVKLQNDMYDPDSCPDYWTMEKTPTTDFPASASDTNKQLLSYRCVPDPNVYDINAIWGDGGVISYSDANNATNNTLYPQMIKKVNNKTVAYADIGTGTDSITTKLKNASSTMYKDIDGLPTSTSNLRCDQVYPAYLATEDEINFPNQPNTLRCKYAEKCGIPWTAVCPNKS